MRKAIKRSKIERCALPFTVTYKTAEGMPFMSQKGNVRTAKVTLTQTATEGKGFVMIEKGADGVNVAVYDDNGAKVPERFIGEQLDELKAMYEQGSLKKVKGC